MILGTDPFRARMDTSAALDQSVPVHIPSQDTQYVQHVALLSHSEQTYTVPDDSGSATGTVHTSSCHTVLQFPEGLLPSAM
jgi:hypothetical protein